jgi:protease I
MNIDLTSVKLAILVANGFESEQVTAPREFLRRAGATSMILSPEKDKVTPAGSDNEESALQVDVILEAADEAGFDALLLPGGQGNVETLTASPKAVALVKSFAVANKPIGAISHAIKLLIDSNAVSGRKVAATSCLPDVSKQAAAEISEKPVVVDGSLVTALDKDAVTAFYQAFAQICSEHKKSAGGSLHTD